MDYEKYNRRVIRSILDEVLFRKNRVYLKLELENESKNFILILYNVDYLSSNFCNLINSELLNNRGIYHDNKNQNLY